MGALYRLHCAACGEPFEARRRHATTCSKRCQQRLRRGAPSPNMPATKSLHSLTPPAALQVGFYLLCRGRLDRPEVLPVNRAGQISSGPFAGRTIREMLRTAGREGWLVRKRRPDGWYAAEWWPERKSIALCGPLGLPLIKGVL